jgi:hypothetical protein
VGAGKSGRLEEKIKDKGHKTKVRGMYRIIPSLEGAGVGKGQLEDTAPCMSAPYPLKGVLNSYMSVMPTAHRAPHTPYRLCG